MNNKFFLTFELTKLMISFGQEQLSAKDNTKNLINKKSPYFIMILKSISKYGLFILANL